MACSSHLLEVLHRAGGGWAKLLLVPLSAGLTVLMSTFIAPAAAQQPPTLLPASPPSHLVVFQVEAAAPAQYDEELTVLDFDPGAWTHERRHTGMAFFSVVDGVVAIRSGNQEQRYTRGQSFRPASGVNYAIGNVGDGKARVVSTVLTSPGSSAVVINTSAATPAKLPTEPFSGKTTWGTVPERFTVNQIIVDFRPGAGSGAHIHPAAQGIVIVMAGQHVHRLLSGDAVQRVGEVFIDGPAGRPVSHENHGSQVLTVVASYVGWSMGGPAALPASIPGVSPLPTPPPPAPSPAPAPISPPRTGDAGLATK